MYKSSMPKAIQLVTGADGTKGWSAGHKFTSLWREKRQWQPCFPGSP